MEATMDPYVVTLNKEGFDYFIKPQLYSDVTIDHNFTDVTLVCEGDKQLKAHKVILGSCSKFFKKVLLKNPHTHPLIYMRGLQFDILEAVTKLIYLGEAQVKKEKVEDILYVMKDLEIDGFEELRNRQDSIEQRNDVIDVAIKNKCSDIPADILSEPVKQIITKDAVTSVESIDECIVVDETLFTKETNDDIIDCEEANVSVLSDQSTATLELSEECDATVEEIVTDEHKEVDTSFEYIKVVEEEHENVKNKVSEGEVLENPSKKICLRIKKVEDMIIASDAENQKEVTDKDALAILPTTTFYKCEQCDFNGAGRAVLKKHIQDEHGFPCDQCNYIATSRGNFWKHKRSIH